MKNSPELTPIQAAYLAGLVDGEGCVGLYERDTKHSGKGAVTPHIFLGLSIAMTNLEVVRYVQTTVGGCVVTSDRRDPCKDGSPRKPIHRWSASNRLSVSILRQILPFLIVKRDQALLAIEWHEKLVAPGINGKHPGRNGKKPISPEQYALRLDYVRRMRELKHV